MTEEEFAEFKREIDEMDALLTSAAEHDRKMEALHPTPEGWEDEMEILHKAGLNRGQP